MKSPYIFKCCIWLTYLGIDDYRDCVIGDEESLGIQISITGNQFELTLII